MTITTFICTKESCPNFNVVYPMLEADETARCGGCGETLIGTVESVENDDI